MRAAWLAVAAAVAAGCGDDVPRFELDVNVSRTSDGTSYVSVHGIDVAARCERAVHVPPAVDTCTPFSDVGFPSCGSWRCVSRFAVEVNGANAASAAAPERFESGVGLEVPALAARDQAVLVIEGCGTSARIPLPTTPLEAPTVTRFSYDDHGVHTFEWTGAEGATSASGYVSGGETGVDCRREGRGVTHVPYPYRQYSSVLFRAISDEGTVETPYGPAQLSRIAVAAEVPPQEQPRFDLEVLYANSGLPDRMARVVVHAVEPDDGCAAERPAIPPVGTCAADSDLVHPPCGSWHCPTSLHVEVGIGAYGNGQSELDGLGDLVLDFPPLGATETGTLVIEGCTTARLALPTTPLAPPTVTSVTQVADGYDFAWAGAEGATSAVARVQSNAVGSFECHSDGRDTAHVTTALQAVDTASLTALSDEGTTDTPLGTVQLWRAAESSALLRGAP